MIPAMTTGTIHFIMRSGRRTPIAEIPTCVKTEDSSRVSLPSFCLQRGSAEMTNWNSRLTWRYHNCAGEQEVSCISTDVHTMLHIIPSTDACAAQRIRSRSESMSRVVELGGQALWPLDTRTSQADGSGAAHSTKERCIHRAEFGDLGTASCYESM